MRDRIQSLDYLISFDPFTAVNLEAVCVGTPVVIHSVGNQWSREDIDAHGWTPYGIGWGIGELGLAKDTVHLAYDHYDGLRGVFQSRIDRFVELTQEAYP